MLPSRVLMIGAFNSPKNEVILRSRSIGSVAPPKPAMSPLSSASDGLRVRFSLRYWKPAAYCKGPADNAARSPDSLPSKELLFDWALSVGPAYLTLAAAKASLNAADCVRDHGL